MRRGNILYGIGAIIIIVCFFLPWVTIEQRYDYTGLQMATGTGAGGGRAPLLFIIPLAAIVTLATAWRAFRGSRTRRASGVAAIVLGIVILAYLFWFFGRFRLDELRALAERYKALYGLWGTLAGTGLKIIGGVIDLF